MIVSLLALAAFAQDPHDGWRTVRTDHFRVSYPVAAEAWALQAASRLEDTRARVVAEVGYDPDRTIDILIRDPYSTTNGMAWPMLHSPRIEGWTTPPTADSVLGNYDTFSDVLFVHEDAHLVHLSRPSRNPLLGAVDDILGIPTMARKTPRWVAEGYATVVESRVTGRGRPFGDARATALRTLAREGRLPGYYSLDANGRWGGMSDAYLVGSAFLEWLEVRQGEGSLKQLWARMTAKKDRNFDDAFSGLFGDTAFVLYGRFTAELTADALAIEATRPELTRERVLDLSRSTGDPAVSPDGTQIALVMSAPNGRSKLKIWNTAPDVEAEENGQTARDKLAARDPIDVPDVAPKARPRNLVATRNFAYREPDAPRWLADGRILFSASIPDGDGRYRPDLFTWRPGKGDHRVTRRQDVHDADPSPDGTWAAAVQGRFGQTAIVRVDLTTGNLTPITPLSASIVYDHPRISPDGSRIVWLQNAGSGWQLIVHELGAGDTVVPLPEGAAPTDPCWTRDGSAIIASVGLHGVYELMRLTLEGVVEPLTQTYSGAFAPDVGSDGVYHLGMDSDGLAVFVTSLSTITLVPATGATSAFRPEDPPRAPLATTVVTPKPYGFGRLEFRPFIGGWSGRDAGSSVLGFRLGDIAGRGEIMAAVASGDDSVFSGARVALSWYGLPVALHAHGFWAFTSEHDRLGGWFEAAVDHRFLTAVAAVRLGLLVDTARLPSDSDTTRIAGLGELALDWSEGHTGWVHASARGRFAYGNTSNTPWSRADLQGTVGVGPYEQVRVTYGLGGTDAKSDLDAFRVGGVASGAVPEPFEWNRTFLGGVSPSESGELYDRMGVEADIGVTWFVERLRIGDHALGPRGDTLFGAKLEYRVDRQPFLRLPAIQTEIGVACAIEDRTAGIDPQPCDSFGDYRTWAGVSWRP